MANLDMCVGPLSAAHYPESASLRRLASHRLKGYVDGIRLIGGSFQVQEVKSTQAEMPQMYYNSSFCPQASATIDAIVFLKSDIEDLIRSISVMIISSSRPSITST